MRIRNRIQKELDHGDIPRVIDALYRYYPKIKGGLQKQGARAQDIKDLFQESLLIFIDKSNQAEFKLSAKPQTFLYSICQNLWRQQQRASTRTTSLTHEPQAEECDMEQHLEKEAYYAKLDKVIAELGESCRQILRLYYLHKKKMAEIASQLNYSSVNVAKTQKYKCLERAKKKAETFVNTHPQTAVK